MEEFKEEEIESILYIGREVSGQPAVAVCCRLDRTHHGQRSVQDPASEEERRTPRAGVG